MAITIHTENKLLRTFLWLVLIVYMAILTKLVIFKRSPGFVKRHFAGLAHHYKWKSFDSNIRDGHLNLVPFHSIKMYLADNMPFKIAVINLMGNIAGFIPLGILLPLLFKRLRSAPATIFCVFLVSLSFEVFQLFGMLGVCDVDDLILNTLGGVIGYFLFWVSGKLFVIK